MAAMAALIAGSAIVPTAAMADHHYNNRSYHGRGGHYRHRCGGGNGAVGTIAGGAGGALLGNALGGGTLGTVAGGVGGALVGRHFDKQHTRHRRGC
jgi:hypothetical protein